jgi:hypothetical protein
MVWGNGVNFVRWRMTLNNDTEMVDRRVRCWCGRVGLDVQRCCQGCRLDYTISLDRELSFVGTMSMFCLGMIGTVGRSEDL